MFTYEKELQLKEFIQHINKKKNEKTLNIKKTLYR